MKKVLLSAVVIVAFLAYAIHQHHEDAAAVAVSANKSSSQTQTTSANGSGQSSGSSGSTQNPTPSSAPSSSSGSYKDGTYTGNVTDAFYGNVQVQVAVQSGKIALVNFLQYPNENRTSQEINSQAIPLLSEEAVQAQSAHVDLISGATQTSRAFVESLTSALAHAA